MKNETIREAYDSVNPSFVEVESMRQRLLDALPQEQSKPSRYTSRPEKTRWWSAVPAAAACVVMLILGGFVLKNSQPEEPELRHETETQESVQESLAEPTEETIPVQTELPDATLPEETATQSLDSPFGPGDYQDYVNWMRQNRWDANRRADLWYAYYDLNNDGVRDLLIGNGEEGFLEAITCMDGELSLLFGVGRQCRVCEDGSILSGEEGDSYYVIYRMSGQEHFVTATVWYDELRNSWFLYNSMTDIEQTITEQQAMDILASYVPVEIEMEPIGSFKVE